MQILCQNCGNPLIKEISNSAIETFRCPKCGFKLESHFAPSFEDLGLKPDLSMVSIKVALKKGNISELKTLMLLRKLLPELLQIPISEIREAATTEGYWNIGTFPSHYALEVKKQAEDLGLTIEMEQIVKPEGS